jgi:hypothetical protein
MCTLQACLHLVQANTSAAPLQVNGESTAYQSLGGGVTQSDPLGGVNVSCTVTKPDGSMTTAQDAANTPFWSVAFPADSLALGRNVVACFVRAVGSHAASGLAKLALQVQVSCSHCLLAVQC